MCVCVCVCVWLFVGSFPCTGEHHAAAQREYKDILHYSVSLSLFLSLLPTSLSAFHFCLTPYARARPAGRPDCVSPFENTAGNRGKRIAGDTNDPVAACSAQVLYHVDVSDCQGWQRGAESR
jgi:hypothetical protein